ncbi:uncharacterized protein LOC129609801 [Condylostylus longicornis]|uniref:uncharacterized protein LOC129609801 n=1 Tax=Condylostylus longicornis TaxID=2530218 RepID=UPI00244E245F|nr:uncharacterized protein LOC129609801 [Condylostylus longicornis]
MEKYKVIRNISNGTLMLTYAGVFFRKYTCKTAKALKLRGWCMNTENQTVKGQLEGPEQEIRKMQEWLSSVGSPKSVIHKAEFSELTMVNKNLFLRTPLMLTFLAKIIHSQEFSTGGAAMANYICDFEVFGVVQGVFFRKYTQEAAKTFNLRGWCMNTSAGTVKGQMEGEASKIKEMQHWLKTTGSPQSRIDKAVFSEIKEINETKFTEFKIVH